MRALNCTKRLCLVGWLALSALASSGFASHTWFVDDDGSPFGDGSPENPFPSIQRAIAHSGTSSGDTILVRPGTYRERVDFAHSLTLIAEAGPDYTVIDAGFRGSVVTIRNRGGWESRLEGFTLRHGTGRFNPIRGEALGGGVFCVNSRATLVDCVLVANATRVGGPDSQLSGRGGGLYAGVGADVVLQSCAITQNDAVDGGGVFVDRGRVAMIGGSLSGNRALGSVHPGRGGGLLAGAGAIVDLSSVTVEANLAEGGPLHEEALGGGIRLEASSQANLSNCLIQGNLCGGPYGSGGDRPGFGGGISSMARLEDFGMTDTILRANRANNGGGLHGKGRLGRCTIEQNVISYGGGGGVEAIDVELLDCVLRDNWSFEAPGGGISVGFGRFARLERCEIASNYARPRGGGGLGGLYVDCDIHDNSARGDGTDYTVGGGGVYGGDLVDCRVWNNQTDDYEDHRAEGGGLRGGTALRTIFHHNFADHAGGGAAWSTLEHCTVVANRTGTSMSTVRNSIVRFNTYGDAEGPSITWSNVAPGTPGVGNLFDDPLFVNAPADDYRLQPGSPCIDAGDPTSPPDPDGSRADMGALPFGG